jgi:hypothetical protein
MEQIRIITTGADIEFFLQETASNTIISAEGLIPGTKDEPFNFDESNKHFAVSLDNVLAEICIPPAKNAEEFYANIAKSRGYVDRLLQGEYCTVALPSANLDEIWLSTPNAMTFGCMPDYNAYTGYANQPPRSNDATLRSAGMHIHVGIENPPVYDEWDYRPSEVHVNITKAMDLYLGVPAILTEPPNKRRKLYGKAGAFRPKPYGLEYRTLSSHFVSDKEKITWAYEATQKAIEWLNSGNVVTEQLSDLIRIAINENNPKQAELLVKEFNLQTA